MNFYIADTHFFDNKCLAYDGRPFSSAAEMNEEMIRRWNKAVGKEDTVYLVGDFCYGNGSDIISTAQRLCGHKILIRGNHDLDVNLKYAFEGIYDYLELKGEDGKVILSHYPMSSFKDMQQGGSVHIYGHVHNSYEAKISNDVYNRLRALGKYHFEAYNVGVMQGYMDYTPRTIAELRERTLRFPLDFSH